VSEDTRRPPGKQARLRFQPCSDGVSRYAKRKRTDPADKSTLVVDHGDGLAEVAFLERDPPPPEPVGELLLQCPCECRRWFVLRQFDDGALTLTPLADEDAP
jgi:hypothetical protein